MMAGILGTKAEDVVEIGIRMALGASNYFPCGSTG